MSITLQPKLIRQDNLRLVEQTLTRFFRNEGGATKLVGDARNNAASDVAAVLDNFSRWKTPSEREIIREYLVGKSNFNNPFILKFKEPERETVNKFYQWAMNGATKPMD